MTKRLLLALILILSSTIPISKHFFSNNHQNNNNIQNSVTKTNISHKTHDKDRSISKYRPVAPSIIVPGHHKKNIPPNIIQSFIDIKLNPLQMKRQGNFFKYDFFLDNKQVTAKDRTLFVTSPKTNKQTPVSTLNERDKGDFFIHVDDFSKLQIRLLIPGQGARQKITNLSLDENILNPIQLSVQNNEINLPSVSFSINVHGISVSPHIDFTMRYMKVGSGEKVSAQIGSFNTYNMDNAFKNFFTSTWGIVAVAILIFIITTVIVCVITVMTAGAGTYAFVSLYSYVILILQLIKTSITVAVLTDGIIAGVIYLSTGLYCAYPGIEYELGDQVYSGWPQNTDPNKPNYNTFVKWTDNKWMFLPGNVSKFTLWNHEFTLLFNKMLTRHNPYSTQHNQNQNAVLAPNPFTKNNEKNGIFNYKNKSQDNNYFDNQYDFYFAH